MRSRGHATKRPGNAVRGMRMIYVGTPGYLLVYQGGLRGVGCWC
jgi:hypothetical protein